MEAQAQAHSGVHAIVVPLPGQGHINPMMQLAKKLASMGISITFVLTHSWHQIITHAYGSTGVDAFAHARNLGLDIRLVAIPDCVPSEFERWNKINQFYQSLDSMEAHVEELINNLHHQSNVTPISCILADTFLGCAVPLAKKLGLLSVSIWTQNVSIFSLSYHSELVQLQARSVIHIPGVIHILYADIPTSLKPTSNPVTVTILDRCLRSVTQADWVVVNSFEGLERRRVEALRDKLRVYCVGPLLPSAYLDPSSHASTPAVVFQPLVASSRVEMDCTQWLDGKPPKSVIYVSFGSLMSVSASQIEEIAMGLKESKCGFMWVLRHPTQETAEVSAVLPEGFLSETKEQGLIVPWCSQLKVLSHPSIGGFLSHCGWNSTLESISSGIPMLGFPLGNEQHTNCKLIADEWKIGLRLRSGDDNDKIIGRKEIAEKVRRLMEGEEMRRAAEKLKDIAMLAVRKGGSSDSNLENVANGLKAKLIQETVSKPGLNCDVLNCNPLKG